MEESKPRVWVPGVCIMEGQHIRLGAGVGWCRGRGISDWKGGAVIYEKAVSPIPDPGSRIDAERWPRVHAVAERCAVTARAVEDEESPDEAATGPRRMVVFWDRRSGGGVVEMRGGDEPAVGFSGALPGRCRLIDEWSSEQDYEDHYDSYDLPGMIPLDRLVRAVSAGRIDESDIEVALRLEECTHSPALLDAWEAWLAAVDERASTQGGRAKKIAKQLRRARKDDSEEVDLPPYGKVELVSWPEVHMARDNDSEPGDDAIVMKAETVFRVVRWRDIDPEWPPSMRVPTSAPASGSSMRWVVAAIVIAAVAFFLTR